MTVGLRQLCCEQGIAGRSFARSVASLKSAAQVVMGEDLFRQVVESEGKAVLKASADEQLEIDGSASGCKTTTPAGQEVSRVYASCDGVIVPDFDELSRAATTDQEKRKRRATAVTKRRQMPPRRRQELPPLPAIKKGSDQRYKQVYLSCFYDQAKEHRLVGGDA